ncbi:MAG: UDP-4-amino-4,6-dideoxy-N-acetyl-beta-L-altrosamine transaminase [Zoogloeaceae bacterium]|jgi:UDP-4-amino-4,6-dideoxy-N-acetyl-beta-L-altrosamine transaminase|nr:UDP-4-amino-4,6-dideoxy-N-acetyl-beta-L-altrosamine transaminase [Zoogloeaceae bacterium]
MIPYGRQEITESDIEAVKAILRSDFLTQGPAVPRFEEAVADYAGASHAVAANSATSALHLACRALGLGPGDWLWTSPITFVASANCALYCGARVDFVDIDPRTCNLSPLALEQKLEAAKKAGRLPKIVVPVHLCGQSCDMAAIHALSQRFGFRIIEDAAHAIGGRYRGEPVGNCRYSDIAVFSFHPVKIITTGEGGMALTNDAALAGKMALLRSHGITRDPVQMTHAPDGPWYYQQIDLGFNYRMTDIQAALGLSQMTRLEAYVTRRRELAARYDQLLRDLPLTLPWQDPDTHSAFHLYIVRLRLDEIRVSHKQAFESLRAQGIGVNLHYIPVYRHPYYQQLGVMEGELPVVEQYYREAISLPVYPLLSKDAQDKVINVLRNIVKT